MIKTDDEIRAEALAYWERYSGKRHLLGETLLTHDAWDQFGWVQGWRFAICDYLYFECGEYVDGFRPSPMGPNEDSYEFDILMNNEESVETCLYTLEILDRYREWLRIAGLDY